MRHHRPTHMRSQRTILLALLISSAAMVLTAAQARAPAPARHNIVLFVPDGLRALIVDEKTTPALAALRDRGVNFASPHSVFPTVTTQNASAMATGHYPGDHGNFGNMFWAGVPIRSVTRSVTPYMESDVALGDMDQAFGGDYLNGATFVKAARDAGIRTAVIGKVGPALIFDHTDRAGEPTIVIDDATGTANGIPLSSEMRARLMAASLPLQSPPRGDNGNIAGTLQSNHVQQDYFVDVTTKVILPWFKAGGQPFVLVFWSRDPDGSEHNEGDSLNRLDPGINGPTSMAGLRDADGDLRRLEDALDALGLTATTDIIVAADHGFSTASKQSETSSAAHASYAGVPRGQLPKRVPRDRPRRTAASAAVRSGQGADAAQCGDVPVPPEWRHRYRSTASARYRRVQWRLGSHLSAGRDACDRGSNRDVPRNAGLHERHLRR